jgi:hypothetical protein
MQVQRLMEGITAQTQSQTLHSLRDPLNQVLHQLQPLVSTIRNQLREQSNDSSGWVTRNMRLQVQAAVGALTQLLTAMLGPQNVPVAVQAQLRSLRFAIASLKLISPDLFEGMSQKLLTITLKPSDACMLQEGRDLMRPICVVRILLPLALLLLFCGHRVVVRSIH